MNHGHFEPEASIPKFWQKKKGNEPTSMQKIAQSMGYEVKKRFSLRRKPCNASDSKYSWEVGKSMCYGWGRGMINCADIYS